jgi:hypothetical protein
MRIKNGLVVGVILLFIGVAVQPSIADNPISSDNVEDCSICPKVSTRLIVRLKSIFDRFEMYDNIQYIISKNHPKIIDIYQKIYYKISEYNQNNGNGRESLCNLLWINIYNLAIKDVFFSNLGDDLEHSNPILCLISYSLAYMYFFRILIVGAFGLIIGCFDYWFEPYFVIDYNV